MFIVEWDKSASLFNTQRENRTLDPPEPVNMAVECCPRIVGFWTPNLLRWDEQLQSAAALVDATPT
jgi:hypothetical protein